MSKFKVGDRIIATVNVNGKKYNGVIEELHRRASVPVWTCRLYGFTYGWGVSEDGKSSCWYVLESSMEHEKEKPIIIYRNGREVIAEDKNTGETGVAKCNPTDVFDFITGAKLAFERLVDTKPKKELLNCKFVVVSTTMTRSFKVGKVYEVKDGKFTTDRDTDSFPSSRPLKDFSDLKVYLEGMDVLFRYGGATEIVRLVEEVEA